MQIVKLKNLFSDIKIGGTPPRSNAEYFGGGLPWVSIRDLSSGRIIERTSETLSELGIQNSNVKKVSKGSLLFSFKLTVGKAAFAGTELYTNEAIAAFEPGNPDVLLEYLYYCLPIYAKRVSRTNNYGAPLLNKEVLKELEIPIPSIEEQREIVMKLDKISELMSMKKEAIEKTEMLTGAVFSEIFGDASMNAKNWAIKELSDVVAPGKIVTYGIVQAGPNIESGIPYIRTGDIKNNEIIVNGLLRTSKDIANSYKRSEVKYGDIVMSIRATVGSCAILPKELDGANLTQGTARISPGSEMETHFLYHLLRSKGIQEWLERNTKGATFKEITLGRLREMPIITPPLPLQKHFSEIARKNQLIADNQKQSLQKLQTLYDSTIQEVFGS